MASEQKLDMSDLSEWNEDQLKELAKLAEQSERYEDMCAFMKALVEKKGDKKVLVPEERNLLSVAYKNIVGNKRSSWRTLTDEEGLQKQFKDVLVAEIGEVCNEVLGLIETGPLAALKVGESDNKNEDMVFYKKMQGDYSRYMAEVDPTGDASDKMQWKDKATSYYKDAWESCIKKDSDGNAALPETHPTRLGLALNYSVCFYEIAKDKSEACKLAKEAFDAAIEKLDTLNDSSYKDSTMIMQLLRDNLTLWTSENEDGGDEAGDPLA